MQNVLPTRWFDHPVRTRLRVAALCLGVAFAGVTNRSTMAQNADFAGSSTQSLLDKAHDFEAHGQRDLAAKAWQQVLLSDHNNVLALTGLARVARRDGNSALAVLYEQRLNAITPGRQKADSVDTAAPDVPQTPQLTQAAQLAESGQYAAAMKIYREVFGTQPPPGGWSLAYYETEAATEDGRAPAVAGLRALVERYPSDLSYQIALGRVMTYTPRTRAEGRKILERFPNDPQAVEAVKQSVEWDTPKPAVKNALTQVLLPPTPVAGPAKKHIPDTPVDVAYRALNAKRFQDAEQRFKKILTTEPDNGRALAGMGYVRMQQSNFDGAISFLEQARQDGVHDPRIEAALTSARFDYGMKEGAVSLNENDLTTAEQQYLNALQIRPASPEALAGLGATLLKAQQPAAATQVFERYAKVMPNATAAWRGLFLSKYAAGNAAGALLTELAIPAPAHEELMRDPEFLRTLASAYSAVGRDADAQVVLRAALNLPFPSDGRGIKAGTQLQYAALLEQANRLGQAEGLYRQVLAADPLNSQAWNGLVRTEHASSQDARALQSVELMPRSSYGLAMRDPAFVATVAAVYQSQNKLDVAQEVLEKAVAQQAAMGQKASPAIETQLGEVYLMQGKASLAEPILRQVLMENPGRVDAWKALLATLHKLGHDEEAVAEEQKIPSQVRPLLDNDTAYLETMGNIYSGLGQPAQALEFLARARRQYEMANSAPPAQIEIQKAYLLFSGANDAELYRQLIVLSDRQDLTEEQRHTVQTIWSLWASRRASQAAASNDNKRALAILNAAAHAFPDNPAVKEVLASGYIRAGLPKQAVLIFKGQDMTSGSAAVYKAAVGAAITAKDNKSAETWLRYGLKQYPKDAELLVLAAQYEALRGDNRKAVEYYKASLAAMPSPDPGAELIHELVQQASTTTSLLPGTPSLKDLAILLGPGTAETNLLAEATTPDRPGHPYLPDLASAYETSPVLLSRLPNIVPSYMTNSDLHASALGSPQTLGSYIPRPVDASPAAYTIFQGQAPDSTLSAQAYQQEQIQRLTRQAQTPTVAPLPSPELPRTGVAGDSESAPAKASESPASSVKPTPEVVYGPYVPYVSPTTKQSSIPH